MSVRAIRTYEYHAPQTLEEIKTFLETYGDKTKILAGGTDVVPKMKSHIYMPDHVVSIRNVKELREYHYDPAVGFLFGSNVKLREMQKMDFLKRDFTALYDGICGMSSTQIRNMSTVVGNICNAVPSADTAPGLIVLNAEIKIESTKGVRVVKAEDFITGVLTTVLRPDEIVTEVFIPPLAKHSASSYMKFAQRRALDLAMVGSAAWILLEGNIVADARIALGAVAIKPKRAENAERALIGNELTENVIKEAARCAGELDCLPITDMRATKEYRIEMVKAMTKDAIIKAADGARKNI